MKKLFCLTGLVFLLGCDDFYSDYKPKTVNLFNGEIELKKDCTEVEGCLEIIHDKVHSVTCYNFIYNAKPTISCMPDFVLENNELESPVK